MENDTNPQFILLFSGKRKSGKDYLTNLLVNQINKFDQIAVIKISASIESHFARTFELDLNELMSVDPYKEKYRARMIEWSDELRSEDNGVFCREATEMYDAKSKPIWIVTDVRKKTDIAWFTETYEDKVETVRIYADEKTRSSRGWVFTKNVDDIATECDLDDYCSWDWIINNNDCQIDNSSNQVLEELSNIVTDLIRKKMDAKENPNSYLQLLPGSQHCVDHHALSSSIDKCSDFVESKLIQGSLQAKHHEVRKLQDLHRLLIEKNKMFANKDKMVTPNIGDTSKKNLARCPICEQYVSQLKIMLHVIHCNIGKDFSTELTGNHRNNVYTMGANVTCTLCRVRFFSFVQLETHDKSECHLANLQKDEGKHNTKYLFCMLCQTGVLKNEATFLRHTVNLVHTTLASRKYINDGVELLVYPNKVNCIPCKANIRFKDLYNHINSNNHLKKGETVEFPKGWCTVCTKTISYVRNHSCGLLQRNKPYVVCELCLECVDNENHFVNCFVLNVAELDSLNTSNNNENYGGSLKTVYDSRIISKFLSLSRRLQTRKDIVENLSVDRSVTRKKRLRRKDRSRSASIGPSPNDPFPQNSSSQITRPSSSSSSNIPLQQNTSSRTSRHPFTMPASYTSSNVSSSSQKNPSPTVSNSKMIPSSSSSFNIPFHQNTGSKTTRHTSTMPVSNTSSSLSQQNRRLRSNSPTPTVSNSKMIPSSSSSFNIPFHQNTGSKTTRHTSTMPVSNTSSNFSSLSQQNRRLRSNSPTPTVFNSKMIPSSSSSFNIPFHQNTGSKTTRHTSTMPVSNTSSNFSSLSQKNRRLRSNSPTPTVSNSKTIPSSSSSSNPPFHDKIDFRTNGPIPVTYYDLTKNSSSSSSSSNTNSRSNSPTYQNRRLRTTIPTPFAPFSRSLSHDIFFHNLSSNNPPANKNKDCCIS